jgi:pyrroline-5-carboxylate reductase
VTLELEGPLVFVGAGKMGGALISGLIARGLDTRQIVVQDPDPSPGIAALLKRHAIPCEPSLTAIETAPSVLFLAVKPQIIETVLPVAAKIAGPATLVLSVAAGRPLESFAAHFAPSTPIIRAMPNTPAAVGRAVTVCVGNAAVSDNNRALCEEILSAVGEVAWIGNESMMDAVTAVSGSGPAYVFLLTEALASAGRAAGLDEALAQRLAIATVSGAGELMHATSADPKTLRENVTSPGGTTAAALSVLMRDDALEKLLERAVAAGADRSRELAK